MAAWPWLVILFGGMALLVALPEAEPQVPTPTFAVMSPTFPQAIYWNTAVFAGQDAYVFAGGFTTSVYRYDPAADQLTLMGAQFPTGRYGLTAVWDGGGTIYLFGGLASNPPANCGSPWGGPMANNVCRQIWAYDIAADTLTMLPVQLPQRMMDMAATWDGGAAYIVGGCTESWPCPALRFDPVAMSVTPLASTLDIIAHRLVWTGSEAYVMGGFVGGGITTGQVWRYEPATDSLTLAGSLPAPRREHEALIAGSAVYVLGGTPSPQAVYGFSVPFSGAALLPAVLPLPTTRASAAEGGPYVGYLFGAGPGYDRIICVGCPDPNAPQPPALTWTLMAQDCDAVLVQFTEGPTIDPAAPHWWEFGDGAASTQANPSHAYTRSGTYLVTLTIVTASGATHSHSLTVEIPPCPGRSHESQPHQGPPEPPRDGVDSGLAGLDADGDGVPDRTDLCPFHPDPAQGDLDLDGQGDACDPDRDGDGVRDGSDNCPVTANADQRDSDRDGAGDACSPPAEAVMPGEPTVALGQGARPAPPPTARPILHAPAGDSDGRDAVVPVAAGAALGVGTLAVLAVALRRRRPPR